MYVKYGFAGKCRRKFHNVQVPSRQTIYNSVNKHRTTGLSIDKKQKHKRRKFTEEKLDDINARLEHTPRVSLKRPAKENDCQSLLQERQHNCWRVDTLKQQQSTCALQPRDPANRVHFSCWFLQSVVEDEIDPQLTFLAHEAWFHLQGYTDTQNNRYWSSQNLHLTHEVQLHPIKIGVWCPVSARRVVVPVFFNETINCERYVHVILGQFFPELTEEERLYMDGFNKTQVLPTLHICLCRLYLKSSGTGLSAVVFCQYVHLILILVIFSSGVVWRTKFTVITLERKN
jgi:transposase